MKPVYHYKVTFSAYVDAGDTYQALLKALNVVRFDSDNVITDIWNKGAVTNLVTELPDKHMSTYYTGFEDKGD